MGKTTKSSIFLELGPEFWVWVHDGLKVDLTHSLVYLGACDTDQNPTLAPAIGARALFDYYTDADDDFSSEVGYYLVQMLSKKSFTAEEVYYNMLLIDETGTTVYEPDKGFNEVFANQEATLTKQAKETGAEGARNQLGPQPWSPKSEIYNVLDAYGTQTYGTTVPYIGHGWLSSSNEDVNGGAIFYLVVAARAPSTGGTVKTGLKNLTTCWNAWWSKKKLAGVTSQSCDQMTPGYPPSANDYWYARYLLSGKEKGFSGVYVPRFTLNDGH
jgi:hypothetical protein